ncbi:MAG TPA: hypothetical protein VK730_02640 [Solirubrobacteraceae bacterium]|jgi:hypothetical protein|nr:hypothetical protein [Solirubrobacteraceae bacterium]
MDAPTEQPEGNIPEPDSGWVGVDRMAPMRQPKGNVPEPGSERGAWAVALALCLLGVTALVLALSGVLGGASSGAVPPPVVAVTPTPVPGAANASGLRGVSSETSEAARAHAGHGAHAIVGDPSPTQAHRDLALYEDQTSTHISERWMQGFYPIYAAAQKTFGVNWLLLASIHRQESAFSTAPGIYSGLNFASCCGGPMQFNVTNGPITTWALVSDSYRYGVRPASYDHMTAKHPSIYDDFDAIMAAAHLLSADGADEELNGAAWDAAYDYYGHDLTGVTYADQVLARAIGWSQHGFCINCGLETAMVQAVNAAYGAPVAASLETATIARKPKRPPPGRSARPRRGR